MSGQVPQESRGRDATNVRQGVEGIALVIGLAFTAAAVGGILSLLIAWVY